MARTYYVKRAQQRYATKPVLNEDGTPKRSPKMRRGVQMRDKRGNLIFMTVTERDLTRPKPMPKCSGPRHEGDREIKPGQPYKYTETYNRTIFRCGTCPPPEVWEYSSSLSARIAQITHEAERVLADVSDLESMESARDDFAAEIRGLADEKEEAASNMEDGFGHSTYQSDEIRDQGEQLSSWADDIGGVDFPEYPEPEEQDCEECNGTGQVSCDECGQTGEVDGEPCPDCNGDAEVDCQACEGTGQVEGEEPTQDQIDEWLEEARSALEEQIGACPV